MTAGTAHERIARHQQAAEILRARSVLVVACVLWIVVGLGLDLTVHERIGHGSLAFVVAVRLVSIAFHVGVLALLFRTPLPPPSVTEPVLAAVFPVTSLALTIISTRTGGLTSPYVCAILVIMVVQAIATSGPWQRGALLAGLSVVIYPAGMLLAALWDDVIRAQLDDPIAVTHFLVFVSVNVAGAIVVAWGGHIVWTLRRSVFESRSIGRYKLVRRIGRGGMGEVWRAYDRALRRDVALKILDRERGKDPAATARFEREFQATAEINHPHIVHVHDWGVTDDGVWYYAMELLEGVDLATLVKRTGPLPPALVVHLGIQAARALAEAHARGVIHRDVKPGNVFVVTPKDELEQAKVLDFGVARIEDADGLTNIGAIIGTPGYIAPEVLSGAQAGVTADVYGLAATLYYALTGKNPLDTGAVPPSQVVKSIPHDVEDAIVRAMDAAPERRHRGADELGIELGASSLADAWKGGLPQLAAEDAPALDATQDAAAPPTSNELPARARGSR